MSFFSFIAACAPPFRSHHLEEDDSEEDSACDLDLEPEQHHGDAAELAQQVEDDEERGQEPAAAPRDVHVLALLRPLDPHADAVLEERRHQAEAGQVGQYVLRLTGHLEKEKRKKGSLKTAKSTMGE